MYLLYRPDNTIPTPVLSITRTLRQYTFETAGILSHRPILIWGDRDVGWAFIVDLTETFQDPMADHSFN